MRHIITDKDNPNYGEVVVIIHRYQHNNWVKVELLRDGAVRMLPKSALGELSPKEEDK